MDDGGGRRGLRLAGVVVSALLVVPAAIVTALRALGAESGPTVYLVALTPWFLLAALVGVLLAIPSRSRWLTVLGIAVVAVQAWWLAPLFLASDDSVRPDVVVASANLKLGQASAQDVVAMVRERDVDVLVLSELTPDARSRLRSAGLDALLTHRAVAAEPGVQGTGVWSRAPLTAAPVTGLYSRAWEVEVEGVTVVAAHPVAPGVRDSSTWLAEHDRLADVVSEIGGPAVLAGDLNATRDHAVVRRYESLGYVDAPDSAGAGLLMTFPQARLPFPVAAIDHVMAREAMAVSFDTVVLEGSDHRAVVAGVLLGR